MTNKILNNKPGWYCGDFHAHTLISSDGHHPPAEFAALAREGGMDFVSMTDHNLIGGWDQVAEDAGILIMPGIEVTLREGHWNVFPIEGPPSWLENLEARYDEPGGVPHHTPFVDQTMKAVKEAGQLNSINHPCLPPWAWLFHDTDLRDVHCLEIINDPTYPGKNGQPSNKEATPAAVEMWTRWLNAGHRITIVGGSDYHGPRVAGESYNPRITHPATYVYASELSVPAIIQGLRERRAYVSMQGTAALAAWVKGKMFDIGQDMGLVEGSVTLGGTVNDFSEDCIVRLVKNGKILVEQTVSDGSHTVEFVDEPGADSAVWYRLEAVDASGEVVLITNPIYAGPVPTPAQTRYGDFL